MHNSLYQELAQRTLTVDLIANKLVITWQQSFSTFSIRQVFYWDHVITADSLISTFDYYLRILLASRTESYDFRLIGRDPLFLSFCTSFLIILTETWVIFTRLTSDEQLIERK